MTTAALSLAPYSFQSDTIDSIKSIFERVASTIQKFKPVKKGWASVACVFNDSWAGRIRGDAVNKILTRARRLRRQAYEAYRMGKPKPF